MRNYAIGVDIGGTHVTSAVVDFNKLKIIEESKVTLEVDTNSSSDSILSVWVACIKASLKKAAAINKEITKQTIAGIGLAIPGPFDYEDGVALIRQQPKLRSLYKMSVRYELAERLGLLEEETELAFLNMSPKDILFKNDAECFLLGEVIKRNDKTIKRAMGITLGTGLGSAYFLDGNLNDANLWCAPFDDSDLPDAFIPKDEDGECKKEKSKIAEEYLSTRWFVNAYKNITKKEVKGAKEVADNFEKNNASDQIFTMFGKNLANFLIPSLKEHKIDTVVIGGNIALAQKYFIKSLKERLDEEFLTPTILFSELGEQAALFGSAALLKK